MPCLSEFAVTIGPSETVTIPKATITGKVLGDDGATVIHDFTGANALDFATMLSLFTAEQLAEMLADAAPDMMYQLSGIMA